MTGIFERLKAPLPSIHWRSQSMNRDGTKALALAYMDARDVMDRLDDVCGPHCWQDSYTETLKGRVVCTISIKIGDEWVSKSDGAGDTAVEGEKGGISDAFKRTAVKWGIGRYLYDMPTPWAECESYEKNGKRYFSKWTPAGLATLAKLQPKAPAAKITDAQADQLKGLLQSSGVNSLDFLKVAKVKAIPDIEAERFQGAWDWILKNTKKKEAV